MSQPELARADELPRGTSFGRYQIVRCVGTGGMGSVYEASHTALGKRVALKVLHATLLADPSIRQRFRREGEAIARIVHPNVVDVLDVGEENGAMYVVMEYLEGDSLLSYIEKKAPLDERTTANLIVPLLAGLMACHDAGIIHRDLKPDNVILTSVGKGVVPKLLDFGISKINSPREGGLALTQQVMLGTPYYMAPEQARQAGDVDERTDQYAMGIILYECVTGQLPYVADSLFDLMNMIVAGKCRRPRELNPQISDELERIIMRAMAASRENRFDSIEELGRDLLPFASTRVRAQYGTSFGLSAESIPPGAMSVEDFKIGRMSASGLAVVSSQGNTSQPGLESVPGLQSAPGIAPAPPINTNTPVQLVASTEQAVPAKPTKKWVLPVAALLMLALGGGIMFVLQSVGHDQVATQDTTPSVPPVANPVVEPAHPQPAATAPENPPALATPTSSGITPPTAVATPTEATPTEATPTEATADEATNRPTKRRVRTPRPTQPDTPVTPPPQHDVDIRLTR